MFFLWGHFTWNWDSIVFEIVTRKSLCQFVFCLAASLEQVHAKPAEDVLFLHGFLSSSAFWTRSVFPAFTESVKDNYRLFAMDLLGFGRSPKPRDCLYTLRNHLEMIEESVIHPFQLKSFHLVAHSMGCVLALALAAKYPDTVKSVTLVAPVIELCFLSLS